MFDDPLNVLGMYLLAMPVAGFLFGVCSECCGDTPCLQFEDDFEIKAGRKVSWPNSTAAFDQTIKFVPTGNLGDCAIAREGTAWFLIAAKCP